MWNTFRHKSENVNLNFLRIATVTIALTALSTPAMAAFPDTQNHWARPFIERLAEQNIVIGYPDGTFKPDKIVQRDEFAAIIRKAFDKPAQRQIASGSVYKDVPDNYWAEPAIEEAYEMGFMSGYPGNIFRPKQNVSRAEALASLMQVLDVPNSSSVTSTNTSTNQTIAPQRTLQQANRNRPRMFLPLAFASLMQPMMALRPAVAATRPTLTQSNTNQTPTTANLSQYYNDANQIPQYAVSAVQQATTGNIVVNHPNVKVLNPRVGATRADVVAFVHQALVSQGRLQALPNNVGASNYVVSSSK